MKKDILFIMNSLCCGGAEKSLVSLLQTIDYSKYNVDLLLFKVEGMFLADVPKEVNIIDYSEDIKYFDMSIKKAIIENLKKLRIRFIVNRIKVGYIYRTEKNIAVAEQRSWKYISKCLKKVNKKYDAAVGYLEKRPIYFFFFLIDANSKIGFIHTDYNELNMNPKYDKYYFEYLDIIAGVSDGCVETLKSKFPMYKEKIHRILNIVSPNVIKNMSKEEINLDKNNESIIITSVGRLNKAKAYELSIESCKLLIDRGYDIKWYVIGEGEERNILQSMIDENGLNDRFILIGAKSNPYPYIKKCDIYVQTSRYEGRCLAITEAKILNKPIVTTNFDVAKDQIENNTNGLIVGMNPYEIYLGISKLIEDKDLKDKFIKNLSLEILDTSNEIDKFYRLTNL